MAGNLRTFPYEDCLFKHYVRTEGWLPECKRRLETVRRDQKRRLRYFTFCAVGAIDVLMLDVAKIISKSSADRFDTVVFFDRGPTEVDETLKRIPGAIGLNGNFVDLVLRDDPHENADPTSSLDERNPNRLTRKLRDELRSLAQRRDLIRQFPFDVINLDLEEFVFKARDPFPGRVVNALRRVFAWQRNQLPVLKTPSHGLNGFSLMFTTRVGPPNLPDSYLRLLRGNINSNIDRQAELGRMLQERVNVGDGNRLQRRNFKLFFELGLPKVLLKILDEQDWYVDPEFGVRTFEFEHRAKTGAYTMLHMVMRVLRKHPPVEDRAPGHHDTPESRDAYRRVARGVFENPADMVNAQVIDRALLRQSLERIRARRRLYYNADAQEPLHCPCGCYG
jgi:hypothetical protein